MQIFIVCYVHCKSCLALVRKNRDFCVFRRPERFKFSYYVHCKSCQGTNCLEQIEILLTLVFAGGQGDANCRSMYIVRVASRHQEKCEILVFSGGRRYKFSYQVHFKSCLAPARKI